MNLTNKLTSNQMILFTEILTHSAGVFNRFYTGFDHWLF